MAVMKTVLICQVALCFFGWSSMGAGGTQDEEGSSRGSGTPHVRNVGEWLSGKDDFSRVFSQTVNVTDMSCGRQNLCQRGLGKLIYSASCFRCHSCYCDDVCHVYGDCCNDKHVLLSAASGAGHSPSYVTCLPKLDFVKTPQRFAEHTGEFHVSKCPVDNILFSGAIARRCEHPDLSVMDEAIPVWSPSSRLSYRNKFCAICHNQTAYEFWGVSSKCNASALFTGVRSQGEIWAKAWTSRDCAISTSPPRENISRSCLRGEMVDSCPRSGNSTSDMVIQLCNNLTNPVQFNRTFYKNAFCAVCNGVSLNRSQECKIPDVSIRIPPVPPISVLLNFYPDTSKKHRKDPDPNRTCPDGNVYNHILSQCSPVICPPRRMFNDSRCQSVFRSCAGLGYNFEFTLVPDQPVVLPSTGIVSRRYERYLRRMLQSYQPFVFTPLDMRISGVRFSTPSKSVRIKAMRVTFKFVSSAKRSVTDLESDLLDVVEKPWILAKDGKKVTFNRLTSNDTGIVGENNLNKHVVQDLSFVRQNDSREVFGKTCLRRNCLSSVEFIDMSDHLSCPSVDLPANHFGGRLFLENQTLTFGNKTVVLKSGTFQESETGLQLCVSEMTRITPSVPVSTHTAAVWRATFSTICLTISDICLFLTFMVYCYLPSLQTLPGKNTMGLVFHLFLAQFLFLCGVNAVTNVVLCQIIGVVLHYMWLSSFFWMFVCAYHMFTVFSNLYGNSPSLSRERSDKRTFIHYCLFADLSPLILIAACASYVLGRSGGRDFGYGGDICFINSIEATGIFFASPLLLILIFNLFFFIRTVLSLQRRPDVIAHSNVCNRNYVGIYFRLSLLLGFGWIFGFFPSNTIMFCLFSVLTGGQGLFIFISFCINRRVLSLLSQKFNCSDFFSQSTSSTKSTGTQ